MTLSGLELLPINTGSKSFDGFPIAFQPENGSQHWRDNLSLIAEHRHALLHEMRRTGAVLLRNFGVGDALAFDELVQALDLPMFTYAESLSNAVRVNVTDRVFTANEAPPELEIFLHHEMAQTPIYPGMLLFFCEIAPSQGGQTPLCRSDRLLEELESVQPSFVARCREHGVKYTNVMPGDDDATSGQGRSWRSTLGVTNREAAEQRLKAMDYNFSWEDSGSLRVTTPALPAVRELENSRSVFFNQLIAAFKGWNDERNIADRSVRFGDDSPMDVDALSAASEAAEALTFDLAWQAGDVALVDNYLVMHGRRPFTGKRRVLASLVADQAT